MTGMFRFLSDPVRGCPTGGWQVTIPSLNTDPATSAGSLLSGTVGTVLDLVAVVAVLAFTSLSVTLARNLKGTALRRGFTLAGLAGLVHLTANLLQVAGDFGLVASEVPPLVFSSIQVVFMVMMALAVQSFFPVWYKAFKKAASHPMGAPGPSASIPR